MLGFSPVSKTLLSCFQTCPGDTWTFEKVGFSRFGKHSSDIKLFQNPIYPFLAGGVVRLRSTAANMGFADFGLTYGNPDFVKYAESYGAKGHRVESSEHLREVLGHCNATPGVHLIDCPVDYSENDRILNKDIKELSKAL